MMITFEPPMMANVETLLTVASGQGARKAIGRSMDRSILAARTAGVKAVGQEYEMKAKDMKSHISKYTNWSDLTAKLTVKGSPTDITEFKINGDKKTGNLSAIVKKGSVRDLSHSFFITTKSRPGIFHRAGSERLPVQREFGPSIAQMFGTAKVTAAMHSRSIEVLDERLAHEVEAMFNGFTGG